MAFFKFRWPGQSEPAQADKPAAKRSRAAPQAESVEAMRRRARHRLIGAAVLVALGVVGFPLLFDTQPRPIAVDIPIEIPDRNKTAPVVVPAAAPTPQAPAPSPVAAPAPAPAAVARQAAPVAPAAAPSSGRTAAGQASAGNGLSEGEEIISSPKPALAPKPPVVAAAPKPEHKPEPKPEPKPVAAATAPAPAPAAPVRSNGNNDEAARARALLEGRSTAPAVAAAASAGAEEGRFIVQVGAFADADKAREARTKVERAGLKTFVQVVDTKDGKRTRVRVGPYSNRAEADKAAGRIRALELSASVLTL